MLVTREAVSTMIDNEDAFYVPDGHRWVATALTSGPWDSGIQHGGPPAALLAREIAGAGGGEGRRIGRITCELLRPVPVGPLHPRAEVVRGGSRLDLVDAWLEDTSGTTVMAARGWRLPHTHVEVPDTAPTGGPALSGPEDGTEPPFFDTPNEVGYHTAISWRFVRGAWCELGPGTAWLRMNVPLIAGETPSPMQRVLVNADSVSGISAVLDPRRHLFPNIDLTVQLLRDPAGEWVCFHAESTVTTAGTGASRATVYDRDGQVGTATQTLLITER